MKRSNLLYGLNLLLLQLKERKRTKEIPDLVLIPITCRKKASQIVNITEIDYQKFGISLEGFGSISFQSTWRREEAESLCVC